MSCNGKRSHRAVIQNDHVSSLLGNSDACLPLGCQVRNIIWIFRIYRSQRKRQWFRNHWKTPFFTGRSVPEQRIIPSRQASYAVSPESYKQLWRTTGFPAHISRCWWARARRYVSKIQQPSPPSTWEAQGLHLPGQRRSLGCCAGRSATSITSPPEPPAADEPCSQLPVPVPWSLPQVNGASLLSVSAFSSAQKEYFARPFSAGGTVERASLSLTAVVMDPSSSGSWVGILQHLFLMLAKYK